MTTFDICLSCEKVPPMKKVKKVPEEQGNFEFKNSNLGFTLNSEVIFTFILYYFIIFGVFRAIFTSFYLELLYQTKGSIGSMRSLGGLMLAVAWFCWAFKNTSDSSVFRRFMRTFFIFFCFELYVAFLDSNLTFLGTLLIQSSSFLFLFITFWVGFLIEI